MFSNTNRIISMSKHKKNAAHYSVQDKHDNSKNSVVKKINEFHDKSIINDNFISIMLTDHTYCPMKSAYEPRHRHSHFVYITCIIHDYLPSLCKCVPSLDPAILL